MSRLRTASLVAGLLTLALSAGGCKQGLNDRCEQNSDCASGLVCDRNGQLTTAEGGRCVNPNAPTTDAGVEDDSGTTDDSGISDTAPDQADDGSSDDASDAATAFDGGDAATGTDAPTDAGGTDAPVD